MKKNKNTTPTISLLPRFTSHADNILRVAWLLSQLEKKQMAPIHIMDAISKENGSLAFNVLTLNDAKSKNSQKNIAGFKIHKSINFNEILPDLGTEAKEILKKAITAAAFHGHKYIGTEHILHGVIKCSDIMKGHKKYNQITNQLEHILRSSSQFQNLKQITKATSALKSLNPLQMPKFPISPFPFSEAAQPKDKFPTLSFFCENLNEKARRGLLSPVFGREKEMQRAINTLIRKSKNNPIFIGEAGVGKTAIVNGIAQKIFKKEILPELQNKIIFSLDVGSLVAGTIFRGDFEARLKDLMEEAKDKDVILFIDEIHTIVGAGSASGTLDLANMLKPALAQSEIKVIAATTPEEYKHSIEKDAALARRFQPILVQEETEENTFAIVNYLKPTYEKHHNINISESAIKSAIYYSKKYINHRRFPDKALDLLDEASAQLKSKIELIPIEKEISKTETKLKEIQKEKINAMSSANYDSAIEYKSLEIMAQNQLLTLRTEYQSMPKILLNLETDHIKDTIFNVLNIKTFEDDTENSPSDIRALLEQKIIGQNEAIEKITQVITRAKAGLLDQNRPIASFLFLGPSGVGKTQTAKELANIVFGENSGYNKKISNFIRLDMSEFAEPHSISRLIGSPPGYVGYEEGGQLTEKIKNNPYSLVLFDEIEKAHPIVFNSFLQILDEGMLTSARSENVSFKNTIIIFTSNIGTEEFNKNAIGFFEKDGQKNVQTEYEKIKKNVTTTLKNIVRPELLNRMDHIVTFMPLDITALQTITNIEMQKLANKLAKEKNIKLTFNKKIIEHLAKKSISQNEGARLVKRVISELVEFPIAENIVKKEVISGDKINIVLKEGGIEIIKS